MNGIIIVNKEAGFTSHDVVAKLRGICGQRKVGHTGTLDPAAVGVLPVCLGTGTRLCDMLADRDKEYVAELLLGVETDTQDTTGRVTAEHSVEITEEEIHRICRSFLGEYEQTPPMYSALKVNGKKLYELAREGKEVERRARPVQIYSLEVLDCRLPVVTLRVSCSKGTYIRTLCADIGARAGCGGTMQSLKRTRVGQFVLEEALTLGQLQKLKDEGRIHQCLRPVDCVFTDCPMLHVRKDALRLLDNGNPVRPEQTLEKECFAPKRWVRFYRPDESFAGIYAYDLTLEKYKPVKMFLEKE
ncbi:MAG: tRNA pseudouridine(55) synthase TruB [Lachnospiraceae bacterium]|nr:tRNA pseudouridine(55) synthase TruB [Lachnospiraceae bacterium]